MNRKIVTNILDYVIKTVSEQEFNRLASGLTIEEKGKKVLDALESLEKLRTDEMPDYHDKWVALFYSWYQPSQINLAYSMIQSIINSTDILNEKLHIVDFGCGSLAMQFGVALAIADTITTKNKKSITEIRIDSIDISQAMIDIGKEMWELFTKLYNQKLYNHLGPVCEIIKPNYYKDIGQVELAQSSDRWISAIHAVYDENKDDIKQSLESLVDRLHPDTCFVSTHESKKSLLKEVWPFSSKPRKTELSLQFNSELTKITEWRRNLNKTLSQSHGYLHIPVTWERHDAEIWHFYSGEREYRPKNLRVG